MYQVVAGARGGALAVYRVHRRAPSAAGANRRVGYGVYSRNVRRAVLARTFATFFLLRRSDTVRSITEKMINRRDRRMAKLEDGTLTLRDVELQVVCESQDDPRWGATLTFPEGRRIKRGETGTLRLSGRNPRSVRISSYSIYEPQTERTSVRVVGLEGTTMKVGL
jgi:hypothetical protein